MRQQSFGISVENGGIQCEDCMFWYQRGYGKVAKGACMISERRNFPKWNCGACQNNIIKIQSGVLKAFAASCEKDNCSQTELISGRKHKSRGISQGNRTR